MSSAGAGLYLGGCVADQFLAARAEYQPGRCRVLLAEHGGRVGGGDDGTDGPVFGIDGLLLQRQEASGGAHPGAPDQPAAGTERVINRAIGDAGPLGHCADRDGLDAALYGEFLGRVEHRVAVAWFSRGRRPRYRARLLSNVCVTRRGNTGCSNLRRRRVRPSQVARL